MRVSPSSLCFKSVKLVTLVTCTSFALYLIREKLISRVSTMVHETLDGVSSGDREQDSEDKKNLKYMLLWTRSDYAPFYYYKTGQTAFIENNCPVRNCYVTSDRSFFDGDTTKFDAIAFNGRNMRSYNVPKHRSPHQKYIYFNMESAENFPIRTEAFNGFFNWTATYRLDSDIPTPYIIIRDNNGEIIGPKLNMKWNLVEEGPVGFDNYYTTKSKAAAWFVSRCKTPSDREERIELLKEALRKYRLSVDIYGPCGSLSCPRKEDNDCNSMLARDYYFYLAYENSLSEDYVTEKALRALQHHVVPIVFGCANYSRFLPPGSYIDGKNATPSELARTMHQLIKDKGAYNRFFRWEKQYTYNDPSSWENVCAVCAALNNKSMVESTTVYKRFDLWWNTGYMKCFRSL